MLLWIAGTAWLTVTVVLFALSAGVGLGLLFRSGGSNANDELRVLAGIIFAVLIGALVGFGLGQRVIDYVHHWSR